MNNNRNKYVQIKNHTFSDQILALLDNAQSDEEEDIEELMNDSDTVFSANDKDIDNIVPDSDNADILTPEASVHIVKDNEKEQRKNSKSKLEKVQFQWRRNIAPNIREECNSFWRGLPPIKRERITLRSGRQFITNPEDMKAFLGTNCIMAVNQLPSISMYWDCDHFTGNNGIQNIFTRGRYQDILQNLHFADNSKQDQTNRGYKIRRIINHLNKSFI